MSRRRRCPWAPGVVAVVAVTGVLDPFVPGIVAVRSSWRMGYLFALEAVGVVTGPGFGWEEEEWGMRTRRS